MSGFLALRVLGLGLGLGVGLGACQREDGQPDPPVQALVPCDPAAGSGDPLACPPADAQVDAPRIDAGVGAPIDAPADATPDAPGDAAHDAM